MLKKYIQAIGIWILIIPIAILNGGFRENILIKLGNLARPISGVTLSMCIILVAFLLIPKIKDCKKIDYILFGVIWFLLTNLFDLTMIIKNGGSFFDLLKMYDVTAGDLWALVVFTSFISPIIVFKVRKLV